jgi:TonB-dependent starch-binding outer membrane protein SusC
MLKIVQPGRVWVFLYLLAMTLQLLLVAPSKSFGAPQQGKLVTISAKNQPLSEILKTLSKKSGVNIFFMGSDVESFKNLSIEATNKDIEIVLASILSGTSLRYEVMSENLIVVKRRENEAKSHIDDSTFYVKGVVVDEKNRPISGATIMVKNTSVGTVAATDGSFRITGINGSESILVSNVSYLTQEVLIRHRSNLGSIQLKEYVKALDEVQIQAYGTTNRRVGTSNISTVKAEDIEKAPVTNVLLAISARVPGVFIQQSTGVPGAGVTALVQGQNSILNGNDPFYVIDGVPYMSQLLPGLTNELGSSGSGIITATLPTQGNPLNFLNPQDIESINILKDADATSIYGSRAANGAIIITTKKGKAGATVGTINIQQGWGKAAHLPSILNGKQYLEMRKEAYANDNNAIPTTPTSGAYDLTYWDQTKNTNWQKVLLGGIAKYTNAQGTLSGGGGNTQYLASVGFNSQGTITPGDLRDNKASFHLNLSSGSNDKRFKFTFSGNYVYDDNRLATVSAIGEAANRLAPDAPDLKNPDGSINWAYLPDGVTATYADGIYNPLSNLKQQYINKTNNLVANSVLSYHILPSLELQSSFGYNRLESNEINTSPLSAYPPSYSAFLVRTANFNTSQINSWVIEPQLKYSKSFDFGSFDLLLGSTLQQEHRDRQNLKASGFTTDDAMLNIKGAASVIVDPSSNAIILSDYKYNAGFARLSYNLAGRYTVSGSIRRDGSSRFGSENRFHNFMSIAGGWIFSDEYFFKNVNSIISFGKLRASYGTTGNDQIGDYAYMNLYGSTPTGGTPYQGIIGLQPLSGFPNPYLQWEQTKKFSSTLDLGFLDNRILVNGTYYVNTSSNQLVGSAIVSITGTTTLQQNLPAKVRNTGLELVINSTNIKGKALSWTTSLNLTVPRNKLVSYGDVDADAKSDLIGKSLTVKKLFHYLGVDPNTGLYIFADHNGKPTSSPSDPEDRLSYVDMNPKYYGGLDNTISYKGISLDFLFQFIHQNAANEFFGSYPGFFAYNQSTSVLDRWTKVGDQKSIQRYSTNYYPTSDLATSSDKAISDASYIRLKNVSLSYDLPSQYLHRIGMKTARVMVQCQNLLTFTKYVGGDPETKSFSGIPPLRMVSVGLQLSL